MKEELKNAFGKVFLQITVDTENRWVHTNWIGYLTKENIVAGALAYTDAVKKAGFSCVLNNTTDVIGGWDHSLKWVVNEWAPQAAEAGLKHFAMVSNPESFAGLSASNFFASLKAFEVKIFDNLPEAETWLRQYCLVNK